MRLKGLSLAFNLGLNAFSNLAVVQFVNGFPVRVVGLKLFSLVPLIPRIL